MKLADLKIEIAKPYNEKLDQTEKFIVCQLKEHPWSCVSCSFGKDSMVVLDIIRQYDPGITVIFCNTRVQAPETYEFKDRMKEELGLNVLETMPVKTFWRVAKEYGLPDGSKKKGRHSMDKCCYYLKHEPARRMITLHKFEQNFTGLTASESWQRSIRICERGLVSKGKGWYQAHPIAFWTVEDVWRYIEENNVPVNPVYAKENRTGCFCCPAHKGWEKRMLKNYPAIYRVIQEKFMGQRLLDV